MRIPSRRRMDLIVFTAVLVTGVLLTAIGVSAKSLATISVALSGLYSAWTGTNRTPGTDHSEASQSEPATAAGPIGEGDGP